MNKILDYYEKSSKIFPNYIILPESKFIYKNILRKQKLIDTINHIKRRKNSSEAYKDVFNSAVFYSIVNQQSDFTHVSNFYCEKEDDESFAKLVNKIEGAEKIASSKKKSPRKHSRSKEIVRELRKHVKNRLSMPSLKLRTMTDKGSSERLTTFTNFNKKNFMLTSRVSDKVSTFNSTARTPSAQRRERKISSSPQKKAVKQAKYSQKYTARDQNLRSSVKKVRIKSIDTREVKMRTMSKESIKERARTLSNDRTSLKTIERVKNKPKRKVTDILEKVGVDYTSKNQRRMDVKTGKMTRFLSKEKLPQRNRNTLLGQKSTERGIGKVRRFKTLIKL